MKIDRNRQLAAIIDSFGFLLRYPYICCFRRQNMKAELMALALLFAFVGFINSQLGPGVADKSAESIAFLSDIVPSNIVPSNAFLFNAFPSIAAQSNGASKLGIDPLWKPNPEVQALLFGLQAAIGCVMFVYFMRHRKKSSDPEWDWR